MRAFRLARRRVRALGFVRARFGALWLVFALGLALGLAGLPQVRFDNALLRFFQSDFPAYEAYAARLDRFESDGDDVIVLIEAEDLARPEALEAVAATLLEAQFIAGVRAVISPLAIEFVLEGAMTPLVPYPLPDRASMAARFAAVSAESAALRRLLAADRSAMLAVVPLAPEPEAQAAALAEIRALIARAEGGGGVRYRIAGAPVLRAQVAGGLIADVIFLNLVGAAVGFAVAAFALRSGLLGLLTLPGPLVSLVLTLGLFGHLGVAITTVSVTLPVLVMILATIDSLHILFERTHQGGRDSRRASLRAVRRLAQPSLYAALTTAIAFGVLAASRAEIIAELGVMGVVALLLSAVMVLLTQALVLDAAGRHPVIRARLHRVAALPPRGVALRALPRFALARARGVSLAAVAALVLALVAYGQAGPRFSLLDSLGPDDPLRATFAAIEAKVAPISNLDVVVSTTDPAILAEVEAILAQVTGSTLVQSLASVTGGAVGAAEAVPEAVMGRLVARDGVQALVSVPFRDEGGAVTLALAARADAALRQDPALAGVEVGPATGMAVMSAAVVGEILGDLNRGLAIAVAVVGLVIALWLGSLRIALLALIPNLLPVALIGGALALSGGGLGLAQALALTLAFGVAVDATLHVLNRLRLTAGRAAPGLAQIRAAMDEATPVLALTSSVLVLGFGGSALAETREVAQFGTLATAVFGLALVADIVVLPAVVAFLGARSYALRKEEHR